MLGKSGLLPNAANPTRVLMNSFVSAHPSGYDVPDWPSSYARKLVTAISGGVFDLLYPVLERDSVDDLGELV